MRRFYASCFIIVLHRLHAFQKPSDHFGAHEISFGELSGWQDDTQADALAAFIQSCPVLANKAQPPSQGSSLQVPESVWQSLCDEANHITPDDNEQAQQFFERRFIPYRVINNAQEQGLFTGYYEPMLYGSLKKKGDFIYPLYIAPPDLAGGKRPISPMPKSITARLMGKSWS